MANTGTRITRSLRECTGRCQIERPFGELWSAPLDSVHPVIDMLTAFPVAPILHPILHTFWDGGLFIAGLLLVFRFSASPRMARFSWKELGIMVAWGQAQEFAVETSGTFVNAWTYADGHWWNPVLFEFANGRITLVPQLVWLAASMLYYFRCLEVLNAERDEDGSGVAVHVERLDIA